MLAITNQSPMNFCRFTSVGRGVGFWVLQEVKQKRNTIIERIASVRYLLDCINLDHFFKKFVNVYVVKAWLSA